MLKQLWKFIRALALTAIFLGGAALVGPRMYTTLATQAHVHTEADAPSAHVAIVFGAGLTRTGLPTPILRDRVETGVHLYQAGKVQKLLMSGDNRDQYYNEPAAMREYALSLGVPDTDIVVDNSGLRTYDTCYRAKYIFGLESALLVTQQFHLPRALYLCSAIGLQAEGVLAQNRRFWPVVLMVWELRESLATWGALVDARTLAPAPIMGDPQPIP